jgi:poly-gamma-glutamate synthesis protein (capsule biosynthesis protein)
VDPALLPSSVLSKAVVAFVPVPPPAPLPVPLLPPLPVPPLSAHTANAAAVLITSAHTATTVMIKTFRFPPNLFADVFSALVLPFVIISLPFMFLCQLANSEVFVNRVRAFTSLYALYLFTMLNREPLGKLNMIKNIFGGRMGYNIYMIKQISINIRICILVLIIALASAPAMAVFAEDAGVSTPADKTEPEPGPVNITISFAGDTILGSNAGQSWFQGVYREKGSGWFFGGVKKLFSKDDLTVVNLESALTKRTAHIRKAGSPVFYFRGEPKYTKILSKGSVEVANISNNHTGDYGAAGYADTKKALRKAKIAYYGNSTVTVRKVKGVKIGFAGLQFTSDKSLIRARIKTAKKKGAEVIIFTLHDGVEATYYPSARPKAAAKAAIDNGADAVIMHHPHRVQGTETYKGKFIAWSIGNFCFGGNRNPSDKDTMIVQLKISKTGKQIKIKPKVIPARLSSKSGYNDLRPKIATGKEKKRIAKKIKRISGNYLR